MKLALPRLLTTLLALLTLALAPPLHADDNTTPVEHIVIIWLKEPGNTRHRDRIINESEVLKDIPGVLSLKSGTVVASDRAIVDSSFDVAMIVSFEDQAAMDAYITHSTHVKLVEKTLKPLVEKIQVYDIR